MVFAYSARSRCRACIPACAGTTPGNINGALLRLAFALILAATVGTHEASASGDSPPATASSQSTCGNGILDAAETCDTCARDCTPAACEPSKSRHRFAVDFTPVQGLQINAATLRIGYRSNHLTLPGSGAEPETRARFHPKGSLTVLTPNDLGYAVRVVLASAAGLSGRLFEIELDGCKGTPAPSNEDVNCTVEACAGSGGPARGCRCSVGRP